MADTKLSALVALGAAPDVADLLYLDDVSATTSKSMTVANLFTSPALTTPNIGTPSAGTLTNCTGLPVAGITASTVTALGVGSVELGHATDTTIARSGAGAITVEGVQVILSGAALGTPASGVLTNCTGLPTTGLIDSPTINMMQHVTVDSTGDAFFEPYSILATNDNFRHLVLRCGANNAAAPTVKAGMCGTFHIPENFNTAGTVTCEVYWTTTLTSGDAVFDLDYRSIGGDDTESLDQATYQQSLTVTDTAPSAANERQKCTMTLTASNMAAGDTFEFFFGRDGADAADTLAGSAIVTEIILKYTL